MIWLQNSGALYHIPNSFKHKLYFTCIFRWRKFKKKIHLIASFVLYYASVHDTKRICYTSLAWKNILDLLLIPINYNLHRPFNNFCMFLVSLNKKSNRSQILPTSIIDFDDNILIAVIHCNNFVILIISIFN